MNNPYPFNPFADSLFGESLMKVCIDLGMERESIDIALQNLVKNKEHLNTTNDCNMNKYIPSDTCYYFTKNATKELLLSTLPIELRTYIQSSDWNNLLNLLTDLARGNLEFQSHSGLDVLFEIMEWILTGFDDKSILERILLNFIPELGDRLKIHTEYILMDKLLLYYNENFLTETK